MLLKHRCGPTTNFLNTGGTALFHKMVRHLGNFSVMQVAKLLLLPKYAALQGVKVKQPQSSPPVFTEKPLLESSCLFRG